MWLSHDLSNQRVGNVNKGGLRSKFASRHGFVMSIPPSPLDRLAVLESPRLADCIYVP